METVVQCAERELRRVWGYPALRSLQRRAVLAALHARDALVVLPTGGGKSICFQLTALLLDGVTLVVSPLISLMQDQVAALNRRGVAAAYLSSTQRPDVQAEVWRRLASGRIKLLYVAPERLPQLLDRAPRLDVSLLAVDEAHCISEWGHDFRPHYRALSRYRRALGQPVTMAVTATATPDTRHDIVRVLGLRRPVTVLGSFDRPNLFFAARRFAREVLRIRSAAQRLRGLDGSAVVYVPTRDRTDGVTQLLRQCGVVAAPYHAGLPAKARRALLARFLDGRIPVMVATTAFGMGIDKPDVRAVVHLGVPPRPEAYVQEAGRAGRDGLPARCDMLWMDGDLALASRMAGLGRTPPERRNRLHASRARALQTMRAYVQTRCCRRRVLLEYLGVTAAPCAGCDRCRV